MTEPLSKLQPIQPDPRRLQDSVANCGGGLPTDIAAPATNVAPPLLQRTRALEATISHQPPPSTCQQKLSISVFFDGTGNNLKADLPTLEHSNVARLFRAHLRPTDGSGSVNVTPIYVPGIGTLFPEIGDDGRGSILGIDHHNGMGAVGQKRLDWALQQVDRLVADAAARSQNPTNKITMISLSVFGFSRGATLARAFIRDLLKPQGGKCVVDGLRLCWAQGSHPFEIRFVGLWDTVASVGAAMSANNVAMIRSSRRSTSNVAREVGGFLNAQYLRAVDLAFGIPGADPAPGAIGGHAAWADGLEIPGALIAGQCVHMIAGHEQRNSFPVDSVLRGASSPHNTKEVVYPGMHSDVGGGYRPGEGGKGAATPMNEDNPNMGNALGRVTLRAMYDEAMAAGVPLRHMNGPSWKMDNELDFQISPLLLDRFNHYMTQTRAGGLPLGDAMLAHMRKFFEWRFHLILSGTRTQHLRQVETNEKVWRSDEQSLKSQKTALADRQRHLQEERQQLVVQSAGASMKQQQAMLRDPTLIDPKTLLMTPAGQDAARAAAEPYQQRLANIDAELAGIELQMKELQARENTLPSRGTLSDHLTKFDAELLDDVRSILAEIAKMPSLRRQLRPHYRHLVEAYENEVAGCGLKDEKIIAFFDNHVHDSLADFDKDWTLPSDPRVVFVGGNAKLPFASADRVAERAVV